MYKYINKHEFKNEMMRLRPAQFSVAALDAIFEYIEEYEGDEFPPTEFDPIAIFCEWTEYEDLEAFQECYDNAVYESMDDIRDYTIVLNCEDSEAFVVAQF